MIGLDQTATVYTDAGGGFVVVDRADLPCRLTHPRGGQTAQDRAEIAAQRALLWEGYAMPEYAQIDVGGTRWNVVAGTLATFRGPDGQEAYRKCLLVRAQ